MAEAMLRDTAHAHSMRYAAMRCFNAAGADPAGRTGQGARSGSPIEVACEAASGKRLFVPVFGTGYDTPDGTCVRDYTSMSAISGTSTASLMKGSVRAAAVSQSTAIWARAALSAKCSRP
jgi:UDP-glucose 4-epimerase